MKQALWLVDVGYVTKASTFMIDYIRTRQQLKHRLGAAVRTILFNGYDEVRGIQDKLQAFYDAMRAQGIEVHLHPMADNRQRRVDIDIAAHVVWGACQGNDVVLTSGDQDFIPCVVLARQSAQVILYTYDRWVSNDLAAVVDERWTFEDDRPQIERRW